MLQQVDAASGLKRLCVTLPLSIHSVSHMQTRAVKLSGLDAGGPETPGVMQGLSASAALCQDINLPM